MNAPRLLPILLIALSTNVAAAAPHWYFPPPGETLAQQDVRAPAEVGIDPAIVSDLDGTANRWALWRHGRLVHVEGDFNQTDEVKSLVKLWFAMTVGAAIQQGKIPSYEQKLGVWRPNLTGNDALATWWNAMTQSTGFDYPGCGDANDYPPGRMWTYSDLNMHELNEALAQVYGRADYTDNYDLVWREAYFDSIGMTGWSSELAADHDRLVLDLEDMGRLGLLMLARGTWNGHLLVPPGFVGELERHQTTGMLINYNGCNDGEILLDPATSPEAPYGYLSWNNRRGDLYPGADTTWAYGSGAGGFCVLWNYRLGIVYAGVGVVESVPQTHGIPQIIEARITGPDPLADSTITSPPPPPPAIIPPGGGNGADGIALSAPSPNPASDVITLRFTLPAAGRVAFTIYDLRGRRVAHVDEQGLAAGPHTLDVPLRDVQGRALPNGWYRVRLEAGGRTISRSFITVR